MNMRTVEFLTVMLVVTGAVAGLHNVAVVVLFVFPLANLLGGLLGGALLGTSQAAPILAGAVAGCWAVLFAARHVSREVFRPTVAALVVCYVGSLLTPFSVRVWGVGRPFTAWLPVLVATLVAAAAQLALAWYVEYGQPAAPTAPPPPSDKPL